MVCFNFMSILLAILGKLPRKKDDKHISLFNKTDNIDISV